jgi:cytidyltransferase-like protein
MTKILSNNKKILDFRKKLKGKKLVLCHGVFDLIHIGHIEHFKQAKSYGDVLIVSVTDDKFVKKGVGRPVFNINERVNALAALSIVDYVIVSNSDSAEMNIKIIKPDFYVKGKDYKKLSLDLTNRITKEKKAAESCGGRIIFTKSDLKSSSKSLFLSNLIYSESLTNFLLNLKKKYTIENLNRYIEKIKNLKILIIGETIIDNYIFCDVIGKASKDPILVFEKKAENKIIGGAASIVLNCLSLCKNVTFLTKTGTKNKSNYNFIKKKLKRVKLKEIKTSEMSINEKLRYVDRGSKRKLMGLYELDKNKNSLIGHKNFKNIFKNFKNYDLVITLDYKHGLIDSKIAKKISLHKNNFINCQLNSSNNNDHNFKNYANSNCMVINENELRNELRDSQGSLKKLISNFANSYNIKKVIITQGSRGAIFYQKNTKKFIEVPSFTNNVVDKVGAGDIILLIVALFAKVSKDYTLGLVIGSMFAAKAVENFGNENVVSNAELNKFVSTFLD